MMSLDAAPNGLTPHGKSNEWYTPSKYIEAARQVMGGITLDPASCELANETVKAEHYYTKEQNGLERRWYGNIWLNPPYSNDKSKPNEHRSTIGRWITRLREQYEQGNVDQAVLLATMQINAAWFQPLWKHPICFANHYIRFYLPHGSASKGREGRTTDSHVHGTIFVYLGDFEQSFINIFSQFGTIARRVNPVIVQEPPPTLWEVRS